MNPIRRYRQYRQHVARIREQYDERNALFPKAPDASKPAEPPVRMADFDRAMKGGTALFTLAVMLRVAVVLLF